ncbi:MAG: threonine/serine dehydratase [Thermomicrobiales bacterium]
MSDMISIEDVREAERRLEGVVNRTPVFTSRTLNERVGREIYIKPESFQRTGAFKFRGAYNAISQLDRNSTKGVVAYSSGNHAQGVALSARLLGIPAVILMHSDAPQNKLAATKGYGAEVIMVDRTSQDGDRMQYEVAEERGMTVVHAYDDPNIMAGQGTAALELLEDVPDLDSLVMPVGGGGLIGGCTIAAKGLKPDIRIFGVETHGADDTHQSLRAGERVEIPPPTTIADGIRLTTPGRLTFPVVQKYAEDVVLVSDEEVLDALRFVLTRMKLVIEPTGAVPIAALLQNRIPGDCEKVGIIISGGNLDPALMASLFAE